MRYIGLACVLVVGCTPPRSIEGVETEEAPLTFVNVPGTSSPYFYDGGTDCASTWGTGPNSSFAGVHCCPRGTVMVGAHIGKNVFKCAQISPAISYPAGYPGGFEQRNGMAACPFGQTLIGYSNSRNFLVCSTGYSPAVISEYVDSTTQDGFPMHVCREDTSNPYQYAMTGIQAAQNHFNCGR